MAVSFDNPWYLLLIPVVAIFLLITQKFMFTREKGVKLGQMIVRMLLFLALIFALSGLNVKFTGRGTTTIYLLDVSDSVRDKKSDVISFVNDSIKDKKKNDKVGIVAFGGDAKAEQMITDNPVFSQFQTEVNTDATNLEEAIDFALKQLPDDSAARIVLVTDGNENEGALKNKTSDLIAKGCVFEVKKIEENISNEVYVSDMKVPTNVGLDENFNIEVEVESNVATNAVVKLYAGRTLKAQEEVYLQKGSNQFIFKDTQSDEGLKTYKVVVEAVDDTISVNNEFSAYTNIQTQMPLLLVEGTDGNAKNYKLMLDAMGIPYNVVSPATVPNDMPDLMEYSGVVFIDVFYGDLREDFPDLLDNYVKNNGGGFIITGGHNSYALGGYRDTVIEDMSPVYMDISGENEVPSMAMCMVIDHSGSMDWGNGVLTNLELAKESAAAAIDYLRPQDKVEVIAFDDTYSRVVPFQNVDDPDEIQKKIYSIGDGGGTSIYPALEAAVKDINRTDAMIKHIILLTDGEDYNEDYDDLLDIINDAGITLSTVAVGDGCNATLLERLANEGGGRVFYTDLDSDLPRIFAQEVFLASNTYIVNETFTPVVTSNDAIIRDVSADGLPELLGYVATTPKERSIELLASFQNDPILAYWQYGLGKTVAWTSDITGEWSANYSLWDGNMEMWNNIIKYISEDNGMEGTYVEVEQNGNKATIKYTTDAFNTEGTEVVAYVYDENGNAEEVELSPMRPGEYEVTIDTKDTGIYTINVQQKDNDVVYSSINTAAIMQYSLEYRFYPDNKLLDEFVAGVGGVFVDAASEVFDYKPEFVKARFNLWIPLLILAMLVFLIDIAVRRFHLSLSFIDKQAAKRAKNKAIKEEQKRKEEAESIKAETAPEKKVETVSTANVKKKPDSTVVKAATTEKKKPEQKKNTNTYQSSSMSGLKNSSTQKPVERTFERSTPAAKPADKPKAPAKPVNAPQQPKNNTQGAGTGSVKDAALKTRVWVRDSDKK